MKKNLFKRGMAGLLSLVMCLTALVGIGTTTAYAAGERAEVYLVSFPRSGDANIDYSGTWGHPNLRYMNGWHSGESKYTTIRAMHSYDGIRVNHTLVYYNHRDEKGCYFSINTPKTKAGEREIPMTEGVKQAFLMEREFQSQAEISSKSRVDGYDDFIFVNRYGDVQNQGNLNKALRRMMRDCNDEILEKYGADSDPVLLPQFSCHILRHTFATRLCESGANLKFIQSILGHADVSTTMNIYVDVTDALKKKEITAFDDYMTTKLET